MIQHTLHDVNFLAVFLAALTTFLIGGLWYSKLMFLNTWMEETGIKETDSKPHPAKVFGLSFLASFIAAIPMSAIIGRDASLLEGAHMGFLIGVAWVGTSFATNYLFENKSAKLFYINAGYNVVSFVVMGLVLAAL